MLIDTSDLLLKYFEQLLHNLLLLRKIYPHMLSVSLWILLRIVVILRLDLVCDRIGMGVKGILGLDEASLVAVFRKVEG